MFSEPRRANVLIWEKRDTYQRGNDFVAGASTICFYEANDDLGTMRLRAGSARIHFFGGASLLLTDNDDKGELHW